MLIKPKPMRRVRVTFVLEEQPDVPFDEAIIRKWLDDTDDLLDPGDYVECVEFPDGMFGEVSDKDIFEAD